MQIPDGAACSESPSHLLSADEFSSAYEAGIRTTAHYVRSMGADQEFGEEVAQAAWVRAWQYRAQLLDPRAIVAWVNTIARNYYLATLEKPCRLAVFHDRVDPPTHWRRIEVLRLVESCTPIEAKILTDLYFEGYSASEIAQREGICATTLRVRLVRLRRVLRERLKSSLPSRGAGAAE